MVGSGDFLTAAKLSQELYVERKDALGIQHPLTIRCQNQLGVALVNSGNPQRGVVFIREAMEASRQNLGPEFPMTLTYQQIWQVPLAFGGQRSLQTEGIVAAI